MTMTSTDGQGAESPLLKNLVSAEDFDQEKELDFLSNLTKQVHEKFIHQWTGVQLEKQLSRQTQQHVDSMKLQKEKLAQIQGQIMNLKTQKESNKRLFASQCDELKDIHLKLKQIQTDTEDLLQTKTQLTKEIKDIQQDNIKQKEWIDTEGKSSEVICQELERAAEHFKKNLGLELRRVSANRLQMVLTSIDNRDVRRPFCVCVRVNEDRSYSISDCEPMVPNLDDLVAKLNETNNFRSFMICLRQSFKALV